jgi:hypothetical protein
MYESGEQACVSCGKVTSPPPPTDSVGGSVGGVASAVSTSTTVLAGYVLALFALLRGAGSAGLCASTLFLWAGLLAG